VSEYVTVEVLANTPVTVGVTQVKLTGGDDGLTGLTDNDYIGSPSANTGIYAFDLIEDLPLLGIPGITTTAVHDGLITYAENRKDTFGVFEVPENLTSTQAVDYVKNEGNFNSSYAAVYWPWVLIQDPITGLTIPRPPSGYVLGRYAYTDTNRQAGVAKAPAGILDGKLNGVIGLQTTPSQGDRDLVYPAKINPLVDFPGDGRLIWGAQTLSSDSSFRLIQVRRLFIFIRSSLLKGMRFVVFENNDTKTRAAVRRTITAFLLTLWRRGMLQGATPEQAFFVTCDETNNPPSIIDQGRLVCDVGVAPQKAAEFFELNLSLDQRALEEELAAAGA
jgi:phage tail sheath protein FI